jgi:hypothetical protein
VFSDFIVLSNKPLSLLSKSLTFMIIFPYEWTQLTSEVVTPSLNNLRLKYGQKEELDVAVQ